jgi:two-component system, LytTR family, response regulator
MAGYNQIKLLIVEDEWVISRYIRKIIESRFDSIVVCDECKTVASAVDSIHKHLPDIVLLDVELTDGTCFDVLEKVKSSEFQKIFITSYSQHALKAIKAHAVDYHLKPINDKDLAASIKRCIDTIRDNEIVKLSQLKIESGKHQKHEEDRFLVVNKKTERILIDYSKIIYVMSDNAYTTVFFINKKSVESVITSIPMKRMEELLPENYFFRIHNRYIINTTYYKQLDGAIAKMEYDIDVPVNIEKAKLLKIRII